MKGGYILLNGKFYKEDEPILRSSEFLNLSLGMKDSFRAENNEIIFAEEYYWYLLDNLDYLGLPVLKDWDLSRFRKDVSRLLNKNHLFLAACVTIYCYSGTGQTNYLLSAEETDRGFYPLNETGLLLDFYDQERKCSSLFGRFECSSRFLWLNASSVMKLRSKNNLLISNEKGFICEGIGVSFGFFQENTLILPSVDSGGYYPPLNRIIALQAEEAGYQVKTRPDISKEDLLEADEVLLIHNCLGIQKVLGLSGRRYYSTKTNILAKCFRESVKAALLKANLG